MVKGVKRHTEEYFQQMEYEAIHKPKIMARILTIGLVVVGMVMLAGIILSPPIEETPVYEKGLDMIYNPETSNIEISFLNLNHDTSNLNIQIFTRYTEQNPLLVYEYSTSEFPTEIFYTPEKTSIHTTIVTVTKDSGNYTYMYEVNPKQQQEMWNNFGRYFDLLK